MSSNLWRKFEFGHGWPEENQPRVQPESSSPQPSKPKTLKRPKTAAFGKKCDYCKIMYLVRRGDNEGRGDVFMESLPTSTSLYTKSHRLLLTLDRTPACCTCKKGPAKTISERQFQRLFRVD